MDEVKENASDFPVFPQQQQQKGNKKRLAQQQQGKFAGDLQNIRLKKTGIYPDLSSSTTDAPIHQTQSEKLTKEMEVPTQQQQHDNVYATIQHGESQQQQVIKDGGDQLKGRVGQIHQTVVQQQAKKIGKDRGEEATELASNAAKKHAKYYDAMLEWLRATRPVQKSASTYNRLRGSNENANETLNRIEESIHTVDFGVSLLVWRLFFFTKDIYEKTGTKGNEFLKLLPSPSSITMAVLLPIAFVFFSPIILGSLFFLVPALFLLLAFVLVPAIFVVPSGLFLLFIFNLLPMPSKNSGGNGTSFASRINFFNRGARMESNGNDEIRATLTYQQPKVH